MSQPHHIRTCTAAEIEALSGLGSGSTLPHWFVLDPLSRYLREANE